MEFVLWKFHCISNSCTANQAVLSLVARQKIYLSYTASAYVMSPWELAVGEYRLYVLNSVL